ncbi:MAG: WYL domain-containing protein [Flavobacterium sp.]
MYINNNFYNFSNNVNYVLDIRNDKNFESIDYEPNLLKRKYISTPATEVEHYCSDIYGVYPIENQTKQEITFLTSIDVTNYFEAYPIHPSQKAEKNNSGSSFFIINVIPSMELIRLFRSYGKHLEVINPDWLRQQTKSLK